MVILRLDSSCTGPAMSKAQIVSSYHLPAHRAQCIVTYKEAAPTDTHVLATMCIAFAPNTCPLPPSQEYGSHIALPLLCRSPCPCSAELTVYMLLYLCLCCIAHSLRWTVTDTCCSPNQQLLVYASIKPVVHLVNIGMAGGPVHSLANITEVRGPACLRLSATEQPAILAPPDVIIIIIMFTLPAQAGLWAA